MEKPLAITLTEAREIINACQTAGVTLMVGFIHRFLACLRELKQRIDAGFFGEISLVVDYLAAGGSWMNPPAWYFDKDKAGGGIVMIGNTHSIDRIGWLLDSVPHTVYAVQKQVTPLGSVEDVASATIVYECGTHASVIGYRSPLKNHVRRHTLEIYGTLAEATLSVSHDNQQQMTITSASGIETFSVSDDQPFVTEIQEFISAIREGRPAKPDGSEGFLSLATITAMYESGKRGQPIHLRNYLNEQELS
jgi:predicted dehydrogenase